VHLARDRDVLEGFFVVADALECDHTCVSAIDQELDVRSVSFGLGGREDPLGLEQRSGLNLYAFLGQALKDGSRVVLLVQRCQRRGVYFHVARHIATVVNFVHLGVKFIKS